MANSLMNEDFEGPHRIETMAKSYPSGDQFTDLNPGICDHLEEAVYATQVQLRNEQITWRNAATSLEKAGVPLEVICAILLPYSGKVISNDVDRRRKPNQREMVDFVIALLDKEGLSWSEAAVLLDNAGISVATICRVLSSYRAE